MRRFGLALFLLAAQAQAQTLEIATDQSPVGLDPQIATSFATQLITSTIYEGLTAIDSDLRVTPGLAAAWTVSPDGKTYEFTLRQGAKFHNGRAVTAQDVIASVTRIRDTKTGSPYASRFASVDTVEPEGDHAVRFVLREPSAPFLSQLASLAIIPSEAVADIARKPVGTGPFRFREWIPDTSIALDRNPDFGDLPYLTGLKFNIVPEAATRQLGLQSGAYRLVPSLDPATATALAGQTRIKILEAPDLAYSLIGLNAARPPFDRPEVRDAVNTALDRSQIIDAAYFGRAVPAGPLSPALKSWALPITEFPCYVPNPARARTLLQQAGLTLPVKFTLNVLGSLQQVVDIAQVVQAQLNQAGFEVTLNVQEQGKFIQDWRASNFQAFASLNSGGPDPDDYFGRTFATAGATNVFKYSNPDLDRLLSQARAESDQPTRKRLYDDAQRLLACQGPAIHLAYGTLFTAIRSDVQGFEPNPTRSLRALRQTKISP
jgi:peptide/nickel transport system substrate-binding protein